jgi:hypothetical protein
MASAPSSTARSTEHVRGEYGSPDQRLLVPSSFASRVLVRRIVRLGQPLLDSERSHGFVRSHLEHRPGIETLGHTVERRRNVPEPVIVRQNQCFAISREGSVPFELHFQEQLLSRIQLILLIMIVLNLGA